MSSDDQDNDALERRQLATDDLNRELSGEQDSRQVRFLTSPDVNGGTSSRRKGKKSASTTHDAAWRIMLDDLRNLLDNAIKITTDRINELERRLTAAFGENFLEVAAEMYLGEDMPVRPPGMSDSQWQAQLQGQMSALMLNPDGSVRDEYAHLPIAQWLALQAQLAELENRADELETTVAELSEGGLTQEEELRLAGTLKAQTLMVLNKVEHDRKEDGLTQTFQVATVDARVVDEANATASQDFAISAAALGIDANEP